MRNFHLLPTDRPKILILGTRQSVFCLLSVRLSGAVAPHSQRRLCFVTSTCTARREWGVKNPPAALEAHSCLARLAPPGPPDGAGR